MTVIKQYEKPAGEIRFGNYIFGQKVVSTKPKRVNTIVTLAKPVNGKTEWVFKLTDLLDVGVEELTPEEEAERAAENQRIRERHFVEQVRDWATSAVTVVDGLAEARAKRLADGWTMLDYSQIQKELAAYAYYDLAVEINGRFNSFDDGTIHAHPGVECEYTEPTESGRKCVIQGTTTEIEVAVELVERMKERLLRSAMRFDPTSGSTNKISNLCEDLKIYAMVQFLNSLRYSSYDIVEIPGY